MSDSNNTATAADDIPTFATLAADPEIAALLDFEPVPRKILVEGGWSQGKQREVIARLAVHGSANKACNEMGMHRTGLTKVYNNPHAASFRAAWHDAVALARRRAERAPAAEAGRSTRPPTVDHRRKHDPSPARGRAHGEYEDDDQPTLSEDDKWGLIHNIGVKFMRKVAVERQARLAGEIVAADFYLRQITHIEVMLDLLSSHFGFDPNDVLRDLRRGRHGLLKIAATEFSDTLDAARRAWWCEEGEPERPPYPDVRFLDRHRSAEGGHAVAADMYAAACAKPPPGVGEGEWQALTKAERQAVIDGIRASDAAEQREWERRAYEDWERRNGEG